MLAERFLDRCSRPRRPGHKGTVIFLIFQIAYLNDNRNQHHFITDRYVGDTMSKKIKLESYH